MDENIWPKLRDGGPGGGPGGDPGGGPGGGPWGGGDKVKKSYSGIAAINKSVRDNKNVLEVKLERSGGARFSLTPLETEGLLVKLGIDSTHFTGVSCCPE